MNPDHDIPLPEPTLGVTMLRPDDCAALDAYIDSANRENPAALSDPRTARVVGWLALYEHDPVAAAPADLTQRTMQRITDMRQRHRFAQQIAMLRGDAPTRGLGFQWRELATTAAVILIGLSLAIPVLDRGRADARRIACNSNLAAAGLGFGLYAQDNAGVMPRREVRQGDAWFHVGEQVRPGQPVRSNPAHLYVLIHTRYVRPNVLNCPDNPNAATVTLAHVGQRQDWHSAAAVSYSYQNQFTPEPIRLDRAASLAVLADKNPLFAIKVHGLDFDSASPPTTSSRFHARLGGQNVLAAAGHVTFTTSPIVTQPGALSDNIWLLDSGPTQRTYTGNESPHTPDRDAFLVP